MKECPSCKAKNRNDAAFCTECGADLKDVPAAADEWASAAGDLLNKAKTAATTGAKKAREAAQTGAAKVQKAMEDADKKAEATKAAGVSAGGWDAAVDTPVSAPAGGAPQKGSSILVDQSEQIVASIGNNYLQNFLTGGNVEQGVGLLTQKRFYFKGKNYTGSGKDMKSSTQEGVVSIDDISFTSFIYTRHTGFLLFAILLTLAAVVCAVAIYGSAGVMTAGVVLVAALLFYVKYFTSRQTLFVISFPGGGFGFDVKYYPIADIRDFQRQLHLLKDYIKEG